MPPLGSPIAGYRPGRVGAQRHPPSREQERQAAPAANRALYESARDDMPVVRTSATQQAYSTVNLMARHAFNDKLSLNLNLNDTFQQDIPDSAGLSRLWSRAQSVRNAEVPVLIHFSPVFPGVCPNALCRGRESLR